MKIVHVGLGRQDDQTRALNTIGEVVEYLDVTKIKPYDFNERLLRIQKGHNPKLFFFQIQHPNILNHSVAELLTKTAVTINWTGDVRKPLPEWYIQTGKLIDCTLFTNMNDVYEMQSKSIRSDYMQIGFPQFIFKKKNLEKKYDICFMGAHNGNYPLSYFRYDMVERLKEKYGDRFIVCGNGWGNIDKNITSIHDQNIECDIYNQSKIAINVSHFNYERYSSDRLWRILGSGTFCLSHHYKDIEKEFKINEHLDTWNMVSDLIEKIEFYLHEQDLREQMALNANKYVHENCTWEKRILKVLDIFNERINTKIK